MRNKKAKRINKHNTPKSYSSAFIVDRETVGGWVGLGGVIVRLFWKTAHVKAALNYNTNHPSALCSPRAPRRHNITPTCVEFA